MLLASFIPQIIGVPKYKIGSRDPHVTPFDPILHFFSLVLTADHLTCHGSERRTEVSTNGKKTKLGQKGHMGVT